MNRRNFLNNLLITGASFSILPGNGRLWKAAIDPKWIPNPAWVDAEYEVTFRYLDRLYLANKNLLHHYRLTLKTRSLSEIPVNFHDSAIGEK